MAGFSYAADEHLHRTNIWDPDLKRQFEDELMGWRWVKMLNFPDGDTLNIPSIGTMNHRNYAEGQHIESRKDGGRLPDDKLGRLWSQSRDLLDCS